MASTQARPRARPVPAAQRRENILSTAAKQFAESGYHGTSMRDIAAACGLTVGALYNHFAGKDAILLALGDRYFGPAVTALQQAADSDSDGLTRLTAMVTASIEVGLRYRYEHLTLTNDVKLIRRTRDLHRLVVARDRCIALWHRVLAEGFADGSIRPDVDAGATIWIVFNAITGLVDDSFEADFGSGAGDRPVEALQAILTDGLRRADRPARGRTRKAAAQ